MPVIFLSNKNENLANLPNTFNIFPNNVVNLRTKPLRKVLRKSKKPPPSSFFVSFCNTIGGCIETNCFNTSMNSLCLLSSS